MTEIPPPDSERDSELALQRRWAESCWPIPFLSTPDGGQVRVISPGHWNRGPGPDFHGAQILDRDGRAQRGDVELHLEPQAWLQHGHAVDDAYRDILLHIVRPSVVDDRPYDVHGSRRTLDPRIPAATPLPEALCRPPLCGPPCARLAARADAPAVEARLHQIAARRFERKVAALRALAVPDGVGGSTGAEDRRAALAAARALGQPHNASLGERTMRLALATSTEWSAFDLPVDQLDASAWRRGRGALGSADGWRIVLRTLVRRWTTAPLRPSTAFRELATLPASEAATALQIPRQLGRARALQLLADAVYPFSGAWRAWSRLPGARYQRTDALRARLSPDAASPNAVQVGAGDGTKSVRGGVRWRHPQTQALLELEQTRCRHQACRICPLASLAR